MSVIAWLSGDSSLLCRYLDLNHIQHAFVEYEAPRVWAVFIGDSKTRVGFRERVFKSRRDASEYAGELNNIINQARSLK